jgi:hypothetical protein
MKKLALILAITLISTVTFAQSDFSGTWKLNTEKSKLGERSFAPKSIVIVQDASTLNIERHTEFQGQENTTTDKLTLDGKECTNIGMMDIPKKSVVTWSEDKTSLKIVSTIAFQDDNTMTMTEIYKISDGSLVIESSMASSFGEMKETQVFDK